MLKSYKYRIYPTDSQKAHLSNFFGSCRFVYNLGLETKIQSWVSAQKRVTCIDLNKQLTELKNTEAPWLRESPSQALQMSLRNLDNAYTNFFRGKGFPKFKSKHSHQSIQFPDNVSIDVENGLLNIPKLKGISCVFHREFTGVMKTVTVSKTTTNRYFVSILVDNQNENPSKEPIVESSSVGIDLGIKTFATLSDSTNFENPKFLRHNLKRLRVEQRKLSRRYKKGAIEQSKGYQRQKVVVAKLHERIRNQREDYLQKVSTSIIQSYDTICMEDLNVAGMVKNHSLALAISEVGWSNFKRMLEYKAEWYGKNILTIGRFDPSSKLCSNCGTINKELRLSDRNWTCSKCSVSHDRDVNAAQNIKTFGLRNGPSTANVSR